MAHVTIYHYLRARNDGIGLPVGRVPWRVMSRFAGLFLMVAMASAGRGENAGGGGEIRVPPTERAQVYLDEAPPGARFDARGLVLLGGRAERFSPPPEFCLFSARRHRPDEGIGYPSTERLEAMELPNEERYPIQLRDLVHPSIHGFAVLGVQSRELPWRVMKAMWDGDALHVKGCRGRVTVSDVYWENVEDGFGPMEGIEHWTLRDAYLRYIRDDAVENDDLVPGEIVNCLVDGCFTFLSQRPVTPRPSAGITTVIRNCLIHVQPQPHDGIPGKEWRERWIQMGDDGIGRAPGMLFKWSEGAGSVEMTDCVVRIDAVSVNGPDDLRFPPGHYGNVVVVWGGQGAYPQPLPEGVSLTRDLEVWKRARRRWIENIAPDHPARRFLWNGGSGSGK